MKWFFGRGKDKKKEAQDAGCSHPVSYQVMLREDASAPTKVTGIKCTQCGKTFASESQMGQGKVA